MRWETELEVQRIRTQVEISGPLERTYRTDSQLLEHAFLLPGAENPAAGKVTQIDNP